MNAAELGKSIRNFRLGLKVSLRELSRCSEISPATLTAIEKGKSSPTLATLDKILKGLGTDLAEFFSCSTENKDKTVFHGDEMQTIADENREYKFLIPKRANIQFEFLYEVIQKSKKETEWETHKGDLGGVIISGGTAILEIQGKGCWTIKKGDSYFIKAGETHRLYAHSKRPVKQVTILV